MARILVVDDDLQLSRLLSRYLQLEGHTVFEANNGREALKQLADTAIDVMVTDIIMPEMDGIELLMSQLSASSRPRIITISGGSPKQGGENLLKTAKLLKADAVLAKPVVLQELSDTIRALLTADDRDGHTS